ncbi:MAG: FAD-binding protein [Anaerolineae bacterium]|nr:FAD-binding protein [Anaerolineae bacterium]
MTPYNPVTPAIVAQLAAIVGPQNLIYAEPERMLDYAHDESFEDEQHMPEVVVKPASAQEISAIMHLANRERIPVTPRGAGSGLSGGAVAIFGGILLSVERMNRILEIDLENLVAVVEPGVVTNELSEAVRAHGLFYAGYPMSVELCYIGGNVAENAGGGRAVKYGVTGRYVLGLEVVLPTGEIVQFGGKRLKDVTGYDLVHLMVGSEGTLGIFTKIILRLLPAPAASAVLLAAFDDPHTAIHAVPRIIQQGHLIPSAVEFMDYAAMKLAYEYTQEKLPHRAARALLLVEVDGYSTAEVEAQQETLAQLLSEAGALDIYVGDTPALARKMWRPRQKIGDAFSALDVAQLDEDMVVPLSQIPPLLPKIEALAARYHMKPFCFGHVADGNMHLHTIAEREVTREEWRAACAAFLTELYTLVVGLGGTISGEHGIGSKRAPYLPIALDPAVIALHRRIKAAFDPLNILNPGKIISATGPASPADR